MAETITNQRLAEIFISELSECSLVYYGGKWYRYITFSGWETENEDDIRCKITNFLINFFDKHGCSKNGGRRDHDNVSEILIDNVMACVQAMVMVMKVRNRLEDPTLWLTWAERRIKAEPVEGWIATRSHHLYVPRVALALYQKNSIPKDAIRPASARLFSPGKVPCDFDPSATCPRWEQFVSEACPDDAKTFQMMFGLSTTYDRRYNVFFVAYGEGGTGKSTALNMLELLNTGNTCSVPLSALGKDFMPYCLTENRLNLVHDIDVTAKRYGQNNRRESILKSVTAGEKATLDRKYEHPELRKYLALLVFGSNTLPTFEGYSRALPNRMRIISFPNVFRGTPRNDVLLPDDLCEELPGILNWALRGYGELISSGASEFPESFSARVMKEEAVKACRPEEFFCDEWMEKCDPWIPEPTMKIYAAFKDFCFRTGYAPDNMNMAIRNIMDYMQAEKKRTTVDGQQCMCLMGARLIDPTKPQDGNGTEEQHNADANENAWATLAKFLGPNDDTPELAQNSPPAMSMGLGGNVLNLFDDDDGKQEDGAHTP